MLSVLFQNGSLNITDAVIFVLSSLFVTFFILPVHEWAHAYTAYRLGDITAKWHDRLTLNPFKHIDWMGAVMIILFGFGWAKPVPVNIMRFKNPKVGSALVSFAGPVSNLVMGFAAIILSHLLLFIGLSSGAFVSFASQYYITNTAGDIIYYISLFFQYIGIINFSLAIFNLLPIPPLDGSKILAILIPERLYYKYMAYERYLSFLLMLLVFSRVLTKPLQVLSGSLFDAVTNLAVFIFGI